MAHYTKTYSEPSDLIVLLKSRGMTIDNEAKAQQYLKRIGYYRMSAYFYPLLAMPKEDHQYKVGSTFRQALDISAPTQHLGKNYPRCFTLLTSGYIIQP